MSREYKIVLAGIVMLILLILPIGMYSKIQGLEQEISYYKNQQKQFTEILWDEYGMDVYAAINYFKQTSTELFEKLRSKNAFITVESISAWNLDANYDVKTRIFWVWHKDYVKPKDKDIVYIKLQAYYRNNLTKLRNFWIEYRVNHTCHKVLGISDSMVQMTVLRYYYRNLSKEIEKMLNFNISTTRESCGELLVLTLKNNIWLNAELECMSTERQSLCWILIGEVDDKTGKLKKIIVTKPFEGSCDKREEEYIMKISAKLELENMALEDLENKILEMTGGKLIEINFER
ncbi:hypothetical protein [Thermococcus paralvinellae]|uniref:Uncharacterized protein n=1 Tax=Thermococcus paralvinellae TaxID=582419 RepID=W0I3K5_9EURY|nr:hypothetical protein [Thermococcus paralvinellae]AHF80656.1 Hypothetical protein TES1_1274 [Thermococcus paralvinellae]